MYAIRSYYGHGERHLPLQACHVELEQPAVLDDLPGDVVLPVGEHRERDVLPSQDAVQDSYNFV